MRKIITFTSKEDVSSKDNEKVVSLLMEYRHEALRLSQYYQHVADDILWYHEENEQIKIQNPDLPICRKYFESETVLTGGLTGKNADDPPPAVSLASI